MLLSRHFGSETYISPFHGAVSQLSTATVYVNQRRHARKRCCCDTRLSIPSDTPIHITRYVSKLVEL